VRALRGAQHCAFLVQHDPDPDAIASSLALRAALGFSPEDAPIVTCGHVTRPENRRLLAELKIAVRHVSSRQLAQLAPLVLVDVQPPYFGELLPEVAAVIDHHPSSGRYRARHRDVRTTYGASATIAAEYLLASRDTALTRPLATALLYGIITDTKSLSRPTSDEDLQAFALLFPRADHAALRRIQHPSYPPRALRRFGAALERTRVVGGLAYLHLGALPADQEYVVAQLAEFCLGMAGAEVSAVSGVFGRKLVMSTRALWPEARLGERLRDLFNDYGSAGGHPVMAKAVVHLAAWRRDHPYRDEGGLERTVRTALRRAGLGTHKPE
jgi:nanoRNase/pAp phosphatase (c-di-AMP/oligoRNAs hydrolase)